jgi:hypothetical protein
VTDASITQILVRDPRVERLWSIGRWTAVVLVAPLLVWLLVDPPAALTVLWYVVIPILPASFFLSTALWRGVCPLATLNEWGNAMRRGRMLRPREAAGLLTSGLVLFHLMVPARRFLFNTEGLALAVTVAAVGALAVGLGALFATRSGFCNSVCPVLPVELLYGHAPLVSLERGRCGTCTTCTPRGCIDLADRKAIAQLLGPSRRSIAWLWTPLGAFFAALPGFIVGYNLVPDGPIAAAPVVYATTLGCSLASYVATATVVLVFRLQTSLAVGLLAAAAGGLYYWFAGPAIAKALEAPGALAWGIRAAGLAFMAYWSARSIPSRGGIAAIG